LRQAFVRSDLGVNGICDLAESAFFSDKIVYESPPGQLEMEFRHLRKVIEGLVVRSDIIDNLGIWSIHLLALDDYQSKSLSLSDRVIRRHSLPEEAFVLRLEALVLCGT
jgi:hypothetical protein